MRVASPKNALEHVRTSLSPPTNCSTGCRHTPGEKCGLVELPPKEEHRSWLGTATPFARFVWIRACKNRRSNLRTNPLLKNRYRANGVTREVQARGGPEVRGDHVTMVNLHDGMARPETDAVRLAFLTELRAHLPGSDPEDLEGESRTQTKVYCSETIIITLQFAWVGMVHTTSTNQIYPPVVQPTIPPLQPHIPK